MDSNENQPWWAGPIPILGASNKDTTFQCIVEIVGETVKTRLLLDDRAWAGEANADSLAPLSPDPRRQAAAIRGPGTRIERVRAAVKDARETDWSAEAGGIAVRLATTSSEGGAASGERSGAVDADALVFAGNIEGPAPGKTIALVYAIVPVRRCDGVGLFLSAVSSRLAVAKQDVDELRGKLRVADLEARGLDHALSIVRDQPDYANDEENIRKSYAVTLCPALNKYKATINERRENK